MLHEHLLIISDQFEKEMVASCETIFNEDTAM